MITKNTTILIGLGKLKLLGSKLEIFVVKRITVWFFIFSVFGLFLENRWYLLLGLFVGAAFCIFRFRSYAYVFQRATDKEIGKRSVVKSILIFSGNQLLLIVLLLIFYFWNRWIFGGFIGGVLLAPFVIVVNCITEVLGITNNHFFI